MSDYIVTDIPKKVLHFDMSYPCLSVSDNFLLTCSVGIYRDSLSVDNRRESAINNS